MLMLGRGFEEVSVEHRKTSGKLTLPVRKTLHSAGYDFFVPESYDGKVLRPNERILIWSDIKAYMNEGEYLALHIRSSLAIKHGLMLTNCTGIIDGDYYNNPSNDGNIGIEFENKSTQNYIFKSGESIAQGIFSLYMRVDGDKAVEERIGGIGSSGK